MQTKIRFFEVMAPIYDLVHFSRRNRTISCIEKKLKLNSKDTVLDLAGGTGRISLPLNKKVKKLFVVDASPKMLTVCARRQLRCAHGYAEKIPFPNGFFDKIIIVDALHHFQDIESSIVEIKRVLKDRGTIFIEEVNPGGKFGTMLKFSENILKMNSRFYSPFELETIFLRHFERVDCQELNKSFYTLVARK